MWTMTTLTSSRLHNVAHANLTLKAEAILQEREGGGNSRQPGLGGVSGWGGGMGDMGGDYSQLECVASRRSFVVFVALQGERGNANVKVGAVGPLNAERPPHVAAGGL